MYTCALNVLHDTGDKYVFAVTDSVNLKLCTRKILVDKYGILYILSKDNSHILFYVSLVEGDYHILTAENVGRTHKYGIAYPVGYLKGFFGSHYGKALRTLYMVHFKKLVETLSVFSHINAVG